MTSAFGDQKVPMMTSIANVGEGWWSIIRDLEAQLNELSPDFELQQVKEKFGGLRYYADPQEGCTVAAAEQFRQLISEAEERSAHTCEVCGEPGENFAVKGWYQTLCGEHRAERSQQSQEGTPDGSETV